MSLKIITGGKTSGTTPPPRSKHYLADDLLRALVRGKRAISREQIAERISKIRREPITVNQVSDVYDDVVKHPDYYGWTIMPVSKGSDNRNRRYVPALYESTDDSATYLIEEDDIPFIDLGMVSHVRTIASYANHAVSSLEAFIDSDVLPTVGKRKYRQLQSMLDVTARTAEEAANKAAKC